MFFGAAFDKDFAVEHTYAETLQGLTVLWVVNICKAEWGIPLFW